MIAGRMRKLDSSGIRKVFDLAREMDNPINLSIGQPHFDVPDEVKRAAEQAIEEGNNRYTVTQGIPELRDALMQRTFGASPPHGEEILITSGASGALMLALLVLVDAGDEVLIPDPYFVMYKHLTNLCGGVPRFIDTYPDFVLTPESLSAAVTPRSKILILNNPANPTGAALNQVEIDALLRVAREHDLFVISDEIYGMFTYDFPAATAAGRYERVLVVNGFSKTHAMTGWRLGYAIGPPEVIHEMTKLQQFSFVCAPTPAQYAGVKALTVDTSARVAEYRKKRDMICDGLSEAFELSRPGGAFYVFPKVPKGTGQEFVEEAIKRNLLVIPGGVFSERDTHFRLSYAAPDEAIEKGIEVLNSMV